MTSLYQGYSQQARTAHGYASVWQVSEEIKHRGAQSYTEGGTKDVSGQVVHASLKLHTKLGPGLLESGC